MNPLMGKVHRYLGLFLFLHLILLAISGVLLMLIPEITESAYPSKVDLKPQKLQEIVNQSLAEYEGYKPVLVLKDKSSLVVRITKKKNLDLSSSLRLTYSIIEHEFEEKTQQKSALFKTILTFHRDLTLGSSGKTYMTYVAFLILVLLLSSLFIVDAKHVRRVLKRGNHSRSTSVNRYDQHLSKGLILLPWLLLITISGILLLNKNSEFTEFQNSMIQNMSASILKGPTQITASQALEQAKKKFPARELYFLAYPGSNYAPSDYYSIFMRSQDFGSSDQRIVLVHRISGKVNVPRLSFLLRLSFASQNIHSGRFGGLFTRLLWLTFVWILFKVIRSGLVLSVRRVSRKRSDLQHNMEIPLHE